ncbi:MAG: ABC transporter ATP-binding protein/permease [Clostridia bacterium]|nr:ABC transporter ATP-binding protein/permease [Clostridia bacterium]
MKVFFRFFRDYPRESVLAPLFKLFEAGFDLLVPLVVASIIDRGIGGDDTAYILRMAGVLVLLAFVGLACVVTAQFFAAKAAVGTAARLRHDLFAHMQSFTYAETDRVGIPTMITRMTSDINQVQSGVNMALRLTLRSPIIVLGSMIVAFTIDVRLAMIFAAVIPLLAAVVFGVMLGGIPLYRQAQTKLDEITGRTRENLNGVRVIRAYRREQQEIDAFEATTEEHTTLQNRAGRLTALMNPVTYVLVNLAVVLLIRQAAPAVDTGRLTQGEVVALVNYMGQILVELVKLANLILLLTKAAACSARVQTVLEMPAGLAVRAEDGLPVPVGENVPAVSFDRVSLTYEGAAAPSLSDITFSVPVGSTVGVIGGTGSGKTSLIDLIPRFYEATEGIVRVMGRDVASYEPAELRARIGVVPQKAELFRGTVRSNLLWGTADGQASDDELWDALEIAQAADFVREKDGGLDAPVEQKGRNFSGGQKQRLTIARALVGRPDILILDDSASALDFATDAALRKALRTLTGTTVFIISQRTSSIRACDRIVVLEEGCAVGIGTHEQLLASCALYREIHESQFKGGDEA